MAARGDRKRLRGELSKNVKGEHVSPLSRFFACVAEASKYRVRTPEPHPGVIIDV